MGTVFSDYALLAKCVEIDNLMVNVHLYICT